MARLRQELAVKTKKLEKYEAAEAPKLLRWLKAKKPALGKIWASFTPKTATSQNGAKLSIQKDDSVLASGKSPATDLYELKGYLSPGVYNTIRLDALTHVSLGNRNGPGRNAGDPNFVLSEITIERLPADGGSAQMLKIQSAIADFDRRVGP